MLIKTSAGLCAGHFIAIQKTVKGKNVTARGAFAYGTDIYFRISVPRRLGIGGGELRLCPDGEGDILFPLSFAGSEGGVDIYTVTLSTVSLCSGRMWGLFYYDLSFFRGRERLVTDTWNNVDFSVTKSENRRFRLLVYRPEFHTPSWFWGKTMYHIFLDRFCRGKGEVYTHGDMIVNEDWENGVPQFAEKAGDPLKNNMFFGGNLWGVIEKLDYLKELGVDVLYLSPMFRAYSNHRYDTGDYEQIDSLLGDEDTFRLLCREAHKRGMYIILDGVFNHTGDDSKYFNKKGTYPGVGAYQGKYSPYADWYFFKNFPTEYESWWGIDIMPKLNPASPSCRKYFTGQNGIIARWLQAGADGWRLDVADELSDGFLDELRQTVKRTTSGKGLIIGEVWENAVDKIAYGKRRRYFAGGQLDSVMNYPFRNAVLAFVLNRDAGRFYDILTEIYASYPREVCNALMNLLGTHDTKRILTVLGDPAEGAGKSNRELSVAKLSPEARALALERLKIASTLQFTVYGVPSVYYGDEAGVEGYHDPFCRLPYPWGREDKELQAHYRSLGKLRREHPALSEGEFSFVKVGNGAIAYQRKLGNDHLLVAANVGEGNFVLPLSGEWKIVGGKKTVKESLVLPKNRAIVLVLK